MKHRILTVGHSNHTAEALLALVKEHGGTVLIDVRSRPYSKYTSQFNRPEFRKFLASNNFKYLWGGKHLGGLDSTSITSPEFLESINKVVALSKTEVPVLMCSEKDPKTCHRAMKLTAWLLRNTKIECYHIVPGKPLLEAREFESKQKPTWGWYEIFPEGGYGQKS